MLGSITTNKASGDDGIPVELFQILNYDTVKVLHSICQQIWKTQQWPQDWKRSVFIPITKEGNAKECSNYCTLALISHASKVMLKILQARLQQYVYWELPDVQAGFRKSRGTRDQIANICWIIEKAREFQKIIYFCFIDYAKAFDCADHNKLWKILKEVGIPDHLTCLLRNLYAGQEATVRTGHGTIEHGQLELDLEQKRRLLRVPWTARGSNQSILKEITPGCSLEGLMLKLKLQYFGHLMWRDDSLEKTLMLGKIEGRRRRGHQRIRLLNDITDSMDMGLGGLRQLVMDTEAWCVLVHGVAKSQIQLSDWTELILLVCWLLSISSRQLYHLEHLMFIICSSIVKKKIILWPISTKCYLSSFCRQNSLCSL